MFDLKSFSVCLSVCLLIYCLFIVRLEMSVLSMSVRRLDGYMYVSTLEENKIPSCPHPCLSALLRGFHRRTRRGKMRKSSGEDFWKTGSYYFSESEILSF